jgi:glycosyltransferase involved in cell wall biosynthesis
VFLTDVQDFELIVVDDGSTDDTEKALKSYGDRLRYFHQENRGPSAARNLGVYHARASWISIQDSDDICAPNHLETLFGFAEKNPDCGMIFANGSYLDDPGPKGKTIIRREKSNGWPKGRGLATFSAQYRTSPAALLSKQALLASADWTRHADLYGSDLGFRFFMRFPVAYLDEVVFFYRRHEGNIGRNQELRLLENLRVIEKLVQDFPSATKILGRKQIDRRKAYRYYRLAKSRWKAGEKDGARNALKQAVFLRPFFLKYRLYQLLGAIF